MRAIELTVLFSFLFISIFKGQSLPSKKNDYLLKRSSAELASLNYSDAISTIDSLQLVDEKLPLSYLMKALVYITYKEDFLTSGYDTLIEDNLDTAIRLSESDKVEGSEEKQNLYQKGLCYSVKSFFEGLNGNYLSAFRYGLKSNSVFSKLNEKDSSFTEATALNIIFRYWKREKLGFIDKFGNTFNRNEALNKLTTLQLKPGYLKYFIKDQIFWILVNEKRFEKAHELAKELTDKFPGNRRFLENFAHAETKLGNLSGSEKIYNMIIDLYKSEKRFSVYHKIYFFHKLAMINFDSEKYKEALYYCDNILSEIRNNSVKKEEFRERIQRVKKLKEKILEIIN